MATIQTHSFSFQLPDSVYVVDGDKVAISCLTNMDNKACIKNIIKNMESGMSELDAIFEEAYAFKKELQDQVPLYDRDGITIWKFGIVFKYLTRYYKEQMGNTGEMTEQDLADDY